jgi:hypothetical protein
MKQAIPFLRTNDQEYKQVIYKKGNGVRSFSIHGGDPLSPLGKTSSTQFSPVKKGSIHESGIPTSDVKNRVTNFIKRREQNWQQYVLPISKLNEEWHKSQKITFERI